VSGLSISTTLTLTNNHLNLIPSLSLYYNDELKVKEMVIRYYNL